MNCPFELRPCDRKPCIARLTVRGHSRRDLAICLILQLNVLIREGHDKNADWSNWLTVRPEQPVNCGRRAALTWVALFISWACSCYLVVHCTHVGNLYFSDAGIEIKFCPWCVRLQRAKEVQDVLLLRRTQRIKPFDHFLRLRRHAATQQTAEEAAVGGVRANCVQQVGSATVVKEK
jgi:hypothetical protein